MTDPDDFSRLSAFKAFVNKTNFVSFLTNIFLQYK